jgi:hypothetical protein
MRMPLQVPLPNSITKAQGSFGSATPSPVCLGTGIDRPKAFGLFGSQVIERQAITRHNIHTEYGSTETELS